MYVVEYSSDSESAKLVLKICVGVLAVCLVIVAYILQRGYRWKLFARTTSNRVPVAISTLIQEAGRSTDAADLERFLDYVSQPLVRPLSDELARVYRPAAQSELRYSHRYIATKPVFVVEQVSLIAMEILRNLPTFKGTKFVWPSPFGCVKVVVEPQKELQELQADLYDFCAMINAVMKSKRDPGLGLTREEELVSNSFTPAGTRTTFAMSMDAEEFVEYVKQLETHPLDEVQQVAIALRLAYKHRYPNLIHPCCTLKPRMIESLQAAIPEAITHALRTDLLPLFQNISLQTDSFHPSLDVLFPRVTYSISVDYASILELQTLIKLDMKGDFLSSFNQFDKWYLERVPAELRKRAEELIERAFNLIDSNKVDMWKAQYFVPVGFRRRLCFSATFSQLRKLFAFIDDEGVSPLLRKRLEKLCVELDGYYPGVFRKISEERKELQVTEEEIFQTRDGLRQRQVNN